MPEHLVDHGALLLCYQHGQQRPFRWSPVIEDEGGPPFVDKQRPRALPLIACIGGRFVNVIPDEEIAFSTTAVPQEKCNDKPTLGLGQSGSVRGVDALPKTRYPHVSRDVARQLRPPRRADL